MFGIQAVCTTPMKSPANTSSSMKFKLWRSCSDWLQRLKHSSEEKNKVAQVGLISALTENALLLKLFFTDKKPELAQTFSGVDVQVVSIITQYYGKSDLKTYSIRAETYLNQLRITYQKKIIRWKWPKLKKKTPEALLTTLQINAIRSSSKASRSVPASTLHTALLNQHSVTNEARIDERTVNAICSVSSNKVLELN